MKTTNKEFWICIVFFALVAFGLYVGIHGTWCDYINDKMHGEECYWCNVYRYANMDNAAFQTRELKREK